MDRPLKTIAIGSVALLLASTAAHAATVTYTASVDGTAIVNEGGGFGTITLPGFVRAVVGADPSDILTSATLSIVNGTFTQTFVANLIDGQTSGFVQGAAGFMTSLLDFAGGTPQNGITFASQNQSGGNQFFQTLNTDNPTYTQILDGTFAACCFASSDLSSFDEVPTVSFAFTFATDDTSTGNNVARGSTAVFSMDAEITYTFAPIPLPAAGWLLLSGVFGLGGLGWYRRRAVA